MLCYLFLFIFTCEPLRHRCYSIQSSALHIQEFSVEICRENLPWLFAARTCRGYLPREFAAGVCRGYLPWLFAVCICNQILFCICEQILFIWTQTFFICKQIFFICEIFFINNVSFCYCRGSYGPPYLWISFSLYLLVEILQLVHEIRSFWEVL